MFGVAGEFEIWLSVLILVDGSLYFSNASHSSPHMKANASNTTTSTLNSPQTNPNLVRKDATQGAQKGLILSGHH